jgi:hypothetical protein
MTSLSFPVAVKGNGSRDRYFVTVNVNDQCQKLEESLARILRKSWWEPENVCFLALKSSSGPVFPNQMSAEPVLLNHLEFKVFK